MKQLVRDPSAAGGVRVADVPEPALLPGTLLVRTAFSAISPGTERNIVSASGLLGAARSVRDRPDLVRRVVDMARRDGIRSTFSRVRARIDATQPLGSSSAGIVVAVGDGVGDRFRPGDRVACTGSGHAIHGEMACVPAMLCLPVPDDVSLEAAAFGTLGAIAIHAVRVAQPQLGERFGVIGLGLVGQLVAQALRAHGARVAAFDLIPARVDLARTCGAEIGASGPADEIVRAASAWTDGCGLDGVIVAAQAPDDGPMVAAARACRHRARIVATGLVPFGLPREIAYERELELRISRSTGPGRHDASYEEGGIDYPLEHVRWTVARNVETFLHAVRDGRLAIQPLVSRRLAIADAARAFESGNGSGQPVGVLLSYPEGSARARSAMLRPSGSGDVVLAVIGAGQFARGTLLPELRRLPGLRIRRIVAATGLSATEVARTSGAEIAGTDADEALADPEVTAVVIATRHDTHASLAVAALRAGKHVFVEKPLALTTAELDAVEAAAREAAGALQVGFNRRFAPLALAARAALAGRGPVAISIRLALPPLPAGHWLLDDRVGGGRLLGEGCHFLDLLSFLAGDADIAAVHSAPVGRSGACADGYLVQLRFADGSAGQVLATSHADSRLPKERIEAHAGGLTVTIDDFRIGTVAGNGETRRLEGRGKGHAEELAAFVAAIRAGGAAMPLDVVLRVSRAAIEARRGLSG